MLRLAGALGPWFWWFRGYWSEARRWLEEALSYRRDAPRALLPVVYYCAAYYTWRFGDDKRAKMLGEEGLAIARDLGDKSNSAFLLSQLGIVAMIQKTYGEAGERHEEAVRVARKAGQWWVLSKCLSNQAVFARVVGDLTLAAALVQEALALDREAGNIAMMSIKLCNLGKMALQKDDYQHAAELFADGLHLSTEVGFRWTTFEGLVGLAGVFSAHGQHTPAARLYGAAEALREAIGHRPTPQDQTNYDRRLASTRSGLGEAAFSSAWAEGRAMTLEQAIEYALETAPRPEEVHGSASNVAPE